MHLEPSYAENSPAAPTDRGVLNSATWGSLLEAIHELVLRNLYWVARKSYPSGKRLKEENCLKYAQNPGDLPGRSVGLLNCQSSLRSCCKFDLQSTHRLLVDKLIHEFIHFTRYP